MFTKRTVLAAASAAALAVASVQPALAIDQPDPAKSADKQMRGKKGVKVGLLKCDVGAGTGFIFGSSRNLNCVYIPAGDAKREYYTGTIKKWGVDLGFIKEGTLLWSVFAPTKNVKARSLAGDYGGVAAEVAVGYGVGANALIGGSKRSIALQPLSVQGVKGWNIAAGIASVALQPAQ